ncbi:MAG TPA: PHP domain-containing protein [Longimicrobiales bacterium]
MRIDLHLHSTASDGGLSPGELVRAAARAGLDVIALGDHDTTAGVAEARRAAEGLLRVVPALEISTTDQGSEIHILGYFVDPDHAALREHARAAAARRRDRILAILERLRALGIHISFDDVLAEAGGSAGVLGRPHVARALVRHGHAATLDQAFEQYLADGRPAFEPMNLIAPARAIELIHLAGGLAVWAHPPLDGVEAEARRLAALGLDGLECFRPRVAPDDARRLGELARGLGLVVTGGSDWHGAWSGILGAFHVTPEDVPDIAARIGL